jgi:hypothetical protein
MPIDDIEFLYRNSIQEHKIITIDSAKRDYRVYPQPNKYHISFSDPFRYVYSMEVLEASIPRTMYNVDAPNCIYRVGVGENPFIRDEQINIRNADYTIDTISREFSYQMKDLKNDYSISCEEQFTGNSTLIFKCKSPFILDMNFLIRQSVGFDTHSDTKDGMYIAIDDGLAKEDPEKNWRLFGSKVYTSKYPVDIAFGRYLDPESTVDVQPLTRGKRILQKFYPSDEFSILRSIELQLKRVGNPVSNTLKWSLYSAFPGSVAPIISGTMTIGEEVVLDLGITCNIARVTGFDSNYLNVINEQIKLVSAQQNVLYTSLIDARLKEDSAAIAAIMVEMNALKEQVQSYYQSNVASMKSSGTYYLEVYDDANDTDDIWNAWVAIYNTNPTIPLAYAWDSYTSDDGGDGWVPLATGFYFSAKIATVENTYAVVAPGMVNLIGERYVIMRCPEIEDHVYGSVAFSQSSPGMALFKLGVIGYADSRMDYSTVKIREFHPLGKLARLSLSFERFDGGLYDFKGVNHNILLVVKYLVPTNKHRKWTKSSLNPNYNPDFTKYLKYNDEKDAESMDDDSDDENDGDNGDAYDDRKQLYSKVKIKPKQVPLRYENEEERRTSLRYVYPSSKVEPLYDESEEDDGYRRRYGYEYQESDDDGDAGSAGASADEDDLETYMGSWVQ